MAYPYPEWVRLEAKAFRLEPPSYEASLYGVWNAMLNTVFPAADGYIVKPQAVVRYETSRRSDDSQASRDSHGRTVSRQSPLYPDFIVARYLGPRSHAAILLVEVKRLDFEVEVGVGHTTRYVDAMGIDHNVRGMAWIVAGNSRAHCYRASGEPDGRGRLEVTGACDGNPVREFMATLRGGVGSGSSPLDPRRLQLSPPGRAWSPTNRGGSAPFLNADLPNADLLDSAPPPPDVDAIDRLLQGGGRKYGT